MSSYLVLALLQCGLMPLLYRRVYSAPAQWRRTQAATTLTIALLQSAQKPHARHTSPKHGHQAKTLTLYQHVELIK